MPILFRVQIWHVWRVPQALDLTANRLSSLEPKLLELPGWCKAEWISVRQPCSNECRSPWRFATLAVPSLAGLQTLSLRQNLLEDASAVTQLASAGQLTELILQDNRLSEVRCLVSPLACNSTCGFAQTLSVQV